MEGLAQLSKPTTNYLVLLLVFFSFAIPLASFASTAYTYDKNGNMTFDGANTYTYDAKNQLTQSVAGDVTTHYTYNYDGQRLSATAINAKKGTSITTYTPSKTYTEIVDNNNPTAPHKTITRILSPGGDWKEIETQGTVTTERYIYPDHLGNVQVVTDEKGAPIQIQDYKTFGSQDLNDTSGTYDSSRKYIGQEFDQDTGLLYLNARYYNPAIGRFLSQDPVFWAIGDEKEVRRLTGKSQQEILMNPQNLNSYSYANNNPVTNSDPSGNFWWEGFYDWSGYNGLNGFGMKTLEVLGGHGRATDVTQQYGNYMDQRSNSLGINSAIPRAITYEEQSHLINLPNLPLESVKDYVAPNLQLGGYDGGVGIMQVSGKVAKNFGDYSKTTVARDPIANINAGTGYIASISQEKKTTDPRVIGQEYNGSLAYGQRVAAQVNNPNYNTNIFVQGFQRTMGALKSLVNSLIKK